MTPILNLPVNKDCRGRGVGTREGCRLVEDRLYTEHWRGGNGKGDYREMNNEQ